MTTRAHTLLFFVFAIVSIPQLRGQVNPSDWEVLAFSSENLITGEIAARSIDADPESQWHTRWHDTRGSAAAEPPHSITVDMKRSHIVTALRYRARAHGEGGLPLEYVLELSSDGTRWDVAKKGAFEFRSRMSPHAVISLEQPAEARLFRLTILSLSDSGQAKEPGLVVGELEIASVDVPLMPTTLIPVRQSREWNYGGYDWAERHRALKAFNSNTHPQLVFLGDSITHRWGAEPTDVTPQTGTTVWKKYYGRRNAVSLGYGWDRVENMLWRIQNGELEDTDPKLVVVMAGTNNFEVNTPEEIALGVARLCEEIHLRKPRTSILLLAIFPRGRQGTFPELEEANRLLSHLGQRSYIAFKDISSAFLEEDSQLSEKVMPDLLHPSEDGYYRWARAIEADVSRVLNDTPISE
ncbi:MAG: discoidin domain-containing protein [Acidobacteriota bacterium]|nr:MAG: discoidin domain-containing protein [Acidobacteriota bacterium]